MQRGEDANRLDIVIIGNFVRDTVITLNGPTNFAMGGSATYSSLATLAYCPEHVNTRIISNMASEDVGFFDTLFSLQQSGHPDLMKGVNMRGVDGTTKYKLIYDEKGRTLTLENKGLPITIDCVKQHVLLQDEHVPDALLFVPVAAEVDERLIIDTVEFLDQHQRKHRQSAPDCCHGKKTVIAFDIQGFLRTFIGEKVTTRSPKEMVEKLTRLSTAMKGRADRFVTILKAEYSEALAVVRENDNADARNLTPQQCSEELQRLGFDVVSVTLGAGGSYVSFADSNKQIQTKYITTFAPDTVCDETGSGDNFLAVTVVEFLRNGGDVLSALEMGSASTSYLVEARGPQGFQPREKVLHRRLHGQRQSFGNLAERLDGQDLSALTLTRYE